MDPEYSSNNARGPRWPGLIRWAILVLALEVVIVGLAVWLFSDRLGAAGIATLLAATLLASGGALAGFLWFLRTRVEQPLNRMVAAFVELEGGNLDAARLPTGGPHEGGGSTNGWGSRLERLVRSHNAAVDRLGDTMDRLYRANQEIADRNDRIQSNREKLHENYLVLEAIKDALAQRNRRLKEVDQRKSEFLASISHDLRGPINAITGFTELTMKTQKGLNSRGRKNLERVVRSGHELSKLVTDILDLARLEAGTIPIETEEFELRELIDDCLVTIDPLLLDKSLEISIDIEGGLDRVRQDRSKVRQILLNLLGNAAKFTEKGAIVVRATASSGDCVPDGLGVLRSELGSGYFQIEVQDTGVGIAPEHLDRIFEQFSQVDEASAGKFGGTGLGLHIVKRLSRLLGGEAFAKSEPDQGSTFSVVLPRVAATVRPVSANAG